MKNRLIAGLSAVVFAAAIFTVTAEAGTKSKISLSTEHVKNQEDADRQEARKTQAQVTPASTDRVVGLIKDMAPQYGVPTWFALRIAKVESGYNPNTRGAAGEYGVYQMKCATAKGIGFSGNCSQLLNASTNIQIRIEAFADGHEAFQRQSQDGGLKA